MHIHANSEVSSEKPELWSQNLQKQRENCCRNKHAVCLTSCLSRQQYKSVWSPSDCVHLVFSKRKGACVCCSGEHSSTFVALRLHHIFVWVSVYRGRRRGWWLQSESCEQMDGRHRGALLNTARQTRQSLQVHRYVRTCFFFFSLFYKWTQEMCAV